MDLDHAAGTAERVGNVLAGLDRARDRGEVIELFAHRPGRTVSWADLEAILAGAQARQLRFYTYAELLSDAPIEPGIALSFDDASIDAWFEGRELYARYGARLTFFITRYPEWSAAGRAQLRALADDGHGVEPHGRGHYDAALYVEEHGVAALMREEVQPSIDALRADGYEPTTYAYPYGKRTRETDRAILARLPQLRSLTYAVQAPLVSSPCPL
ncbi:MAG: polysaccharide deacetylase family protein [Kofleriaceae bacterium]